MNLVEPPPSQPGDDLDGLLRAFMRSQLPQPWPPLRPLPVVTKFQHRPATGRNLMRSRWTLAASVALLFLGAWLLPSRWPMDAKTEHALPAFMISDRPRDLLKERKKQKPVQNKNKPGLAADHDEPPFDLEDSDVPMLR